MKKSIFEITKMTSRQISEYITEITQTPICADKKYCDKIVKIYLNKPINEKISSTQLTLL